VPGAFLTLHLYFARRFLISFLAISIVFLVLMMLIGMIDQVRRFKDIDIGSGELFLLTLLNTPATMNNILPLLLILSTIALFVSLARSSELVVTRAIGRSGLSTLMAPGVVALVIGLLAVSSLGPIIAASSSRYDRLAQSLLNWDDEIVSLSAEGMWLRQGDQSGQTVIHATGYSNTTATLYGVTFIAFAPNGGPLRRAYAETAELGEGEWILRSAKVWPLAVGLNPESGSAEHDILRLPTNLTQQRISDTLSRTEGFSVWDLPQTIQDLRAAGFSTTRHEVLLQAELARPLFLVAMVLVAAAFTMRHVRFGGTGVGVLAAVLLGFALYFLRNFAHVLGENGQLSPALAAWVPAMASLMLGLGFLLKAEDG